MTSSRKTTKIKPKGQVQREKCPFSVPFLVPFQSHGTSRFVKLLGRRAAREPCVEAVEGDRRITGVQQLLETTKKGGWKNQMQKNIVNVCMTIASWLLCFCVFTSSLWLVTVNMFLAYDNLNYLKSGFKNTCAHRRSSKVYQEPYPPWFRWSMVKSADPQLSICMEQCIIPSLKLLQHITGLLSLQNS